MNCPGGEAAVRVVREVGPATSSWRVPRVSAVAALAAIVLGCVLALCSAGAALAAQTPPRPERGAVLDQAEILSADEEGRLNQQIGQRNRDNEHARVAVLTVRDTGGASIEDFARQTATAWGVGEKGRDNGVLVVADMGKRELRIEVADGAREVLSDGRAKDIMSDKLEPGFAEGEYASALTRTVDAIYEQATPEAAAARASEARTVRNVVIGLVGAGIVAVIGVIVWWTRDQRRIREQADNEIARYLRERPDEDISEDTRKAYYRYRSTHRKPPRSQKPRTVKDDEGVERELHYASTFPAWLPLYMASPSLYNGSSSSSLDSGSGSAGMSFGGGGGFSGGGATGRF